MSKQVTDFTDVELKAIAYDNLKRMELLQRENVNIERELADRAKTEQEFKPQPLDQK